MDLSRHVGENASRLQPRSTHAPRRVSADAALRLLCQHPDSLIDRPGCAQSLDSSANYLIIQFYCLV
jgi:hypothetical protein